MKNLLIFIATFFNVGKFTIAPGTLASAITAGIFFLSNYFLSPDIYSQTGAIFIIFLIGIPSAKTAEIHFGIKDPQAVVIDEVAGQMVSLLFIPAKFSIYSIGFYIAGFFIFRFFDIFKPFPVNIADRIKGGFGIMIDDILAGLYSLATIQILIYILNNLLL